MCTHNRNTYELLPFQDMEYKQPVMYCPECFELDKACFAYANGHMVADLKTDNTVTNNFTSLPQ